MFSSNRILKPHAVSSASTSTRSVSVIPKRYGISFGHAASALATEVPFDLHFTEVLDLMFRALRDDHATRTAADRILEQIENEIKAKRRTQQLLQH